MGAAVDRPLILVFVNNAIVLTDPSGDLEVFFEFVALCCLYGRENETWNLRRLVLIK